MESRNEFDAEKKRQVFIKPDESLHRSQIRTLNVLRGQSKCDSLDQRSQLTDQLTLLQPTVPSDYLYEIVTNYIAEIAPAIIHVPARVIQLLIRDDFYRSVYEVSSKPGYTTGRTAAESRCFLKLYDNVTNFERPKYGCLNYLNAPAGVPSAAMYGDCYFTLKQSVRKRITISSGDTFTNVSIGVLDFCNHVLMTIEQPNLITLCKVALGEIRSGKYSDNPVYKELQIHGEVKLSRDIASVHAPAADYATIGQTITEFSERFNVPIVWF